MTEYFSISTSMEMYIDQVDKLTKVIRIIMKIVIKI